MAWIKEDIEQWRGILTHEQLTIAPMARDAFLSAINEIERLRKRIIQVERLSTP